VEKCELKRTSALLKEVGAFLRMQRRGVFYAFELGLAMTVIDTAASQETRNSQQRQLPFGFSGILVLLFDLFRRTKARFGKSIDCGCGRTLRHRPRFVIGLTAEESEA
jgi:hypothetical protein